LDGVLEAAVKVVLPLVSVWPRFGSFVVSRASSVLVGGRCPEVLFLVSKFWELTPPSAVEQVLFVSVWWSDWLSFLLGVASKRVGCCCLGFEQVSERVWSSLPFWSLLAGKSFPVWQESA